MDEHVHLWIPVDGDDGRWRHMGVGKSRKPEDHRDVRCPCGARSYETRPHQHSALPGEKYCNGCGMIVGR